MRAKLICIAEDDSEDFNFLDTAINEFIPGCELIWSKDGDEFLEAMETLPNQKTPSLIILDYNMPKLNGLQALKALKENSRYRDVPVVFYSSGSFRHYISEIMEEGASGYFEKGITYDQIRDNVKNMLEYMKVADTSANDN